jgi:hypothetical protein
MTEQKVLKEKIERRFEALSDTWFQNELMEQTKHYLSRGRRFELLAADQLNQEWATAFRRYVRFRVGLHVLNMADAWAELRLRVAELPTHYVTSELEQLQYDIIWIDPAVPALEFDRRLDTYIQELSRPTDEDSAAREFLS